MQLFAGHRIAGGSAQVNRMIEFTNVYYKYPDGTEALKGVSYRIRKAEKVALVGPNGSGKSTFLLHTNGLLFPTAGTVRVDGLEVNQKNAKDIRSVVGIVFQDSDDQVFSPTVFEDVAFGPMNLGESKERVIEKVNKALQQVGLEGFERRSAHHLSGGEKKKVALAGILAMNPDVIVLDEPTANLDPQSADSLMRLLDDLHLSGKTVLIATHDVDLVSEWADRVCVLNDGQVIKDCSPHEAFGDTQLMRDTHLRPPIVHRVFEGIFNPTPTNIRQAREKLRHLKPK
jgi:cobalt/nickel transport system ATP-binding protein